MDGTPLQLALREMRDTFSSPRMLTGMAAVAVVLGLSGPFGTAQQLGLAQRLVYWLAIVVTTYGVCRPVALLTLRALRPRVPSIWVAAALAGAVTGTPVTLIVVAINLVAFNDRVGLGLLELWINCTLITIATLIVGTLLRQSQLQQAAAVAAAPASPPAPMPQPRGPALLERLPHPQRGRLLALSVRDHYVEVVTDRGRGLLLMRLSDAIGETEPVAGLQIHRSHWVALEAVKRVIKADGKVSVELPGGERLPVSRGFLPAAKEAGLVV